MDKNVNNWLRKDLRKFEPYHTPKMPYKYKLDANESPLGLSPKVKETIINWIQNEENLNIYPDTDNTELRNTLAVFWNVSPENITCGVGSDQLIDYITKAFLEYEEKILVLSPTFSMYGLSAIINKGNIEQLHLNDDFNITADEVIKKVNESNPKILFLCTPNNPTGNSISFSEITKILENVNIPVVVDEAYAEFSNSTFIDKIGNYKNLIVLRTFSKAYALAGARVGYAIANRDMIDAINIVKPPFNLPTLSQLLAIAVINDNKTYKDRIEYIISQREKVEAELNNISWIKVYKSEANFIYIESEKEINNSLMNNGILVRNFSLTENDRIKTPNIKEKLRLTIGADEENIALLKCIKSYDFD